MSRDPYLGIFKLGELSGSLTSAIALGLIVYASTNVDDLLVLAVFFADARARVGAVVAGRFIGLAVLVIASVAATLLALAVSPEWVALLGFVPLFLGLRLSWKLLADSREDAAAVRGRDEDAMKYKIQRGFMSQALAVAGVTLASGGDNLGVYIPLFAATPGAIAVYVAVFAVMTALWCALGYLVVNSPFLGVQIRRYGHVLLPIVLIALGAYILSGAAELMG